MNRRLLLSLLGVALALAPPAAADRYEDVYEVDSDVHVDIEILQGRIEIEGWGKDEVRVRARGSGADGLDVEVEHDWVSIRAGGRGLGFFLGGEVDLRIDVPKDSHIQAKTLNGRIKAKDVEGTLSLHTVNGSIDVDGEPEEVFLETVSSSIDFRGKDSRVDARSMSGSIELRGVGEEVEASSMSGSIRIREGKLERAEVNTMSGSIDIEAELENDARLYAKTHSGTITLTVPENTSAHFDVETRSGSIKNDFGPHAKRRRGAHRLDFDTGDGKGRVTLENTSGSIRIRAD